jgi:hypothetical protein
LPSSNAQAPLIACFEPRKVPLWSRGNEIIAPLFAELQKLVGHDGAHQMQANIVFIGFAAAIPKETR